MKSPMRLALIRHAEGAGNILSDDDRAEDTIANHRYNLTPRGRKQAEITGAYLREQYGEFDAHYSSYYERSVESMAIMFPHKKIHEDARLAEIQRGIWQTMSTARINERFPEEIARQKKEGPYHYRPWGGENCVDAEVRIRSFIEMLKEKHSGQNITLGVHGRWLILFERLMVGFSIEETVRNFRESIVENASVLIYENFQRKSYVVPWEGKL